MLRDCQKIGLSLENFPLKGAEWVGIFFKKFTQLRLQIARGRRLHHFVDGRLIERLLIEQGIFHICTISVQTSPN